MENITSVKDGLKMIKFIKKFYPKASLEQQLQFAYNTGYMNRLEKEEAKKRKH